MMNPDAPPIVKIKLGTGTVKVSTFKDAHGAGIVFQPVTEMVVGTRLPNLELAAGQMIPRGGETYIHCNSRQSAAILLEQVALVLASFSKDTK